MYTVGTRQFYQELFRLIFGVFAIVSFLLRPEVAAQGVLQGLSLCYRSVIPALFPFFVLSKLILTSPLAPVLSLPLLPYTRYVLGIRDARAATALLLGLTGGFGGGASCLQTLYTIGALTPIEAKRLLWCLINAGPAFVVVGVGATMLYSTAAGWFLYAALCLASLCSGAFCRLGERHKKNRIAPKHHTPMAPPSFLDCVREAVAAMLTLCGFVLFFSFFLAVLAPPSARVLTRFFLSLPIEVTAACALASSASTPYKLYFCCTALSIMGVSIFLQVRSLVPTEISLRPLLLSRTVHLPFSLLFLWLLLRLFPFALTTATQAMPRLLMPVDACCAVFLLCCTFFCVATRDASCTVGYNKRRK